MTQQIAHEAPRRPTRRWWRALDLFAIAMIVYVVLWATTGDRFWPIVALDYASPLLLPLSFLALPYALYRRKWRTVGLQVVCAVAFFWIFRDVFVPNDHPQAPAGATTVNVLTYNLGDGLVSPGELESLLADSDADIVGLVEVTPEMAAALPVELKALYPYQEVRGLGIPGEGLLSRYPITSATWHEFNPGRPDLQAVIDLNGTPITVIVAHPPPPHLTLTGIKSRPGTTGQLDSLITLIEGVQGPLIVLGDFNITRMHEEYQRLESAGLTDVFRNAGHGVGFTSLIRLQKPHVIPGWVSRFRFPATMRIDYVWVSDDWLPMDAWVGDDAGSDHLPVLATLALTGTSP